MVTRSKALHLACFLQLSARNGHEPGVGEPSSFSFGEISPSSDVPVHSIASFLISVMYTRLKINSRKVLLNISDYLDL